MPVSPLNPVSDDKDDTRIVIRVQNSDRDSAYDPGRLSQHSRTTSNNTLLTIESPPISPRHVRSFPIRRNSNSVGDMADVSRLSLAYGNGYNPESPRRETFSSPKTRPMTMFSIVQSSIKIERERAKSTMLTPDAVIPKPWTSTRDPYRRFSYFLTYAMVLLGLLLGGVRIFFGWRDVQLLQGNLCLVMDENFDSEVGIFGDNGKFFREVEMGGFGYFLTVKIQTSPDLIFAIETANSKWQPLRTVIPMLKMAICTLHLLSPRMPLAKLRSSTDTFTILLIARITSPKASHTLPPQLSHLGLINQLRTFKHVRPSVMLQVDKL